MKEIWKDIEEYDDCYQISNLGNIRSLKFGKERILKLAVSGSGSKSKSNGGYKFAVLMCNGKRKIAYTHTLVWDYFGNKSRDGRKLQVDHIDGDKTNNVITNLQLLTTRDNVSKGYIGKKTTSQYVGVSWDRDAGNWMSRIWIDGKSKYFGLFDNEYAAHIAYQNVVYKINTTVA